MLDTLLRPFRRKTSAVEISGDPFAALAARYRRRLAANRGPQMPKISGARVGVVVAPWQQTAVPFYVIEWAIRLRREGLAVEFVWDAWPHDDGTPTAEETEILGVLEAVRRDFEIPTVRPERSAPAVTRPTPRLDTLAFETVTRGRGMEPREDDPEIAAESGRLRAHVGRVERLLAQRSYAWILVPGGVWAVSGVYWEACDALGIGLTTFDSGPGLLCFQHGGPAAHFPDLRSAMRLLAESCRRSEAVRRTVECWVDERLNVRRRGDDEFELQPRSAVEAPFRADIVVPLNYRLDTAAMCRQKLFSSVRGWLEALVEWAARHPGVTLAVRQHPCEKIPEYRSKEDYSFISGRTEPNIHFIAAGDPINTYDLLAPCRVVLPYSSRVGIEGGVLGKSVILAAHTYYEEMDFVRAPASREEYFSLIESQLESAVPSTESRISAYAAYYVAESFGLHRTRFTPIPSDFDAWVAQSPEELWAQGENPEFVRATAGRRPLADLLVERFIARCLAT